MRHLLHIKSQAHKKCNNLKEGAKPVAQIITVAAIKGGTGKTATSGALAQAAVEANKRVLAIDLDPQSNLSIWLAADLAHPGSYQLLKGDPPQATLQATESGVDLICGSANLAAEKTRPGSAKRLRQAIENIKDKYDLIFIDTAPAMGELQNNALYASTGLIIPLAADAFSLQGLYQIVDVAQHIQQGNPALQILGSVITQYDPRPNINRFMRDTIKEKGAENGAPLLGEIRGGVAVREAMAMQESLFLYAPKSKPTEDYRTLFRTIMEVISNG